MKRCPSCGESKPPANFGRNKSLKDGLSFYCLECNRQRNNAWYRRRRQSMGKQVRDHSWVPDGYRWCPSCRRAVAHEDYTRSRLTASGFGARCKPCHNAASSEYYFYRTYKLTKSQVAGIRAAQDNRCAICGEADPEHLDHDHATGRMRQLLCQRCNQGLGLLRDDPAVLRAAADYVEEHRRRQRPQPLRTRRDEVTVRPGARRRSGWRSLEIRRSPMCTRLQAHLDALART
jgi:Recombination endonuclease VII